MRESYFEQEGKRIQERIDLARLGMYAALEFVEFKEKKSVAEIFNSLTDNVFENKNNKPKSINTNINLTKNLNNLNQQNKTLISNKIKEINIQIKKKYSKSHFARLLLIFLVNNILVFFIRIVIEIFDIVFFF